VKRDLLIVLADKNMEFAVRGALTRHQALGTRAIDFEIRTHPNRDAGVRTTGASQLRLERDDFTHGLLMLDSEGSGAAATAMELEAALDERLHLDWGADAKAIVIEPEVEAWIWGSDNAMETVLGWDEAQHLRAWLSQPPRGFSLTPHGKPSRPKEAFEHVLRQLKKPRSSSLYAALTSKISLHSCKDPAFVRLRSVLREWFRP
jgi:hypothetical protein